MKIEPVFLIIMCLLYERGNAKSPVKFGERSTLSEERRQALRSLVFQGGANMNHLSYKKPTQNEVDKPKSSALDTYHRANSRREEFQQGCMNKVVMVEEIEFDTEIQCKHVLQESCFQSYTTTFKLTEVEECDESFKKECDIEYFKVPRETMVEICNEVLSRNCSAEGNIVCSKEYETVCETLHQEYDVQEDLSNCVTELVEVCKADELGQEMCDNVPKQNCEVFQQTSTKLTPTTECRKEMADICGPETCPIVKDQRLCRHEIKTIINEVPRETCNILPRKQCKLVSKVVPTLEPVKHCMSIPKEICSKSRVNHVKKRRPVIRKWCFNDKEEDISMPPLNIQLPAVPTQPPLPQAPPPSTSPPLINPPIHVPNPLLDNVIYAYHETDLNGKEAAEVFIFDIINDKVLCKKHVYYKHSPGSTNVLVEGQWVMQCGRDDMDCHIYIKDGLTKEMSLGLTRMDAANFVYDEVWYVIGGENSKSKHSNEVFKVPVSKKADLIKRDELTFSDLFPGLDWAPGRGCFLKFAGPNHSNISLYASSDFEPSVDKIKVAIKWDRGSDGVAVKTMDLDNYKFNTKSRPLCGHAVNFDKGETNVFMVVRDLEAERFDEVPVLSIRIPTVDSNDLTNFMMQANDVKPGLVNQEGLKSMALIGHEDNFTQGNTINANVWLGDHRNIILVEGRGAAIYNAKTDSLEDGPLEPLYWKWFLAGRATKDFVKSIGCQNF